MPDPSRPPVYDVIIVGAGFAGSLLAKQLSWAGKRVLVLEAGNRIAPNQESLRTHLETFFLANAKVPDSPYPNNPNAPQADILNLAPITPTQPDTNGYFVQKGPFPFGSDYVRRMGGTSLHWLGTSLRLVPNDFKLNSVYGQGMDWPITYDDLMPYYQRAEYEIGVAADVEDQGYLGILFSSSYVYPMKKVPQSYSDQWISRRLQGMSIDFEGQQYPVKVTSTPQARNSTPNPPYQPVGGIGDPLTGERCEGNSNCIPICPAQAKYTALKTFYSAKADNITLISQAVVSGLEIDPVSGRIQKVNYKRYFRNDDPAHVDETAVGTIVVLAGDAVENAKILLASNAANSSDQVGRNLMDHPYFLTWCLLPEHVGTCRGPISTSGIEVLRDGAFRANRAAFRIEIGNLGWDFGTNSPYSDAVAAVQTNHLYGSELRRFLYDRVQRQLRIGWLIEQLPDPSNRVTLDPLYRDALGLCRPVISYSLSQYTLDGFAAAKMTSDLLMARLGAVDYTSGDPGAPGYVQYGDNSYTVYGAGHVVGTHRMGDGRQTSVVNYRQQTWDHENLYLVGCGNFPTVATGNPSLTMAALAFWAGDNILQDLR